MPLALVAIGQTNAMLVGGFDVSVAALMTMCVVTASFTLHARRVGARAVPGRARDPRRRPRDRDLQRDADPRPPPPVDHRHARHAQHPRGRVAAAARPSRGHDQQRRDRRAEHERRVRAARVHRRRRASPCSPTCGSTARARAWRVRAVGLDETSSRRLGMSTGLHRVPRLRRLLGDGVDRRLLLRGPGPDRLADHRQLRARRASPRPSSAARASRAGEDRSSGHCWRRSSSR